MLVFVMLISPCCSANPFRALARSTLRTSNLWSIPLRTCHPGVRLTQALGTSQLSWNLSIVLTQNFTPMS